MTSQLQLPLAPRASDSTASHEEVAALIAWLGGRGWVREAEISTAFPAWASKDGRKVRAIASESHGRILSSAHGYKLTAECSLQELEQSIGRWRSQIRQLTQRVIDTEHVYHRGPDR